MFVQVSITIYDPLDRKLDLKQALSPFFISDSIWNNCSTVGTYVQCGSYFIMKRMQALGLKCIQEPCEVKKEDIDTFSLMFFSSMIMSKGYVFPEEELKELKAFTGHTQLTLAPDLPSSPEFDGIRNQFNSVKNALEIFKNNTV